MPTQNVPGIEPIVVQAIEHVFPSIQDQKRAFDYILEYEGPGTRSLLALLYYSKGDIEIFRDRSAQSHPHFWMDEISHIFPTMKDAEEWVKSLSKSQSEKKE
jgi:hypothetical protein